MNLPMLNGDAGNLGLADGPLMLENIPLLQDEVRALARERSAVILPHNYQPPGGDSAGGKDFVGGLARAERRRAAAAEAETIVKFPVRGALHGRDGVRPVSPETRSDPRS